MVLNSNGMSIDLTNVPFYPFTQEDMEVFPGVSSNIPLIARTEGLELVVDGGFLVVYEEDGDLLFVHQM